MSKLVIYQYFYHTDYFKRRDGGSSQYTNRRQLNIPPSVKHYDASASERLRLPCQAQTTGDLQEHMISNEKIGFVRTCETKATKG